MLGAQRFPDIWFGSLYLDSGKWLGEFIWWRFWCFPPFCFVSVEAFRSEPPAKAYHANKRILEDRFCFFFAILKLLFPRMRALQVGIVCTTNTYELWTFAFESFPIPCRVSNEWTNERMVEWMSEWIKEGRKECNLAILHARNELMLHIVGITTLQ